MRVFTFCFLMGPDWHIKLLEQVEISRKLPPLLLRMEPGSMQHPVQAKASERWNRFVYLKMDYWKEEFESPCCIFRNAIFVVVVFGLFGMIVASSSFFDVNIYAGLYHSLNVIAQVSSA